MDDAAVDEAADTGTFTAAPALPSVALPKPGGAIRGLGEKHAVNAATGTASFTIPVATSPGRGGFDLGLSLAYDSGAGNGPFGLGFQLSVPNISRRTDRGVPRYYDDDVFILAGAEDLVLVPYENPDGTIAAESERVVAGVHFRVHQFRPRTEGLFARIERWSRRDGDVHWRVITRDNLTHLYGRDRQARVADPAVASKVFSWLLDETRDDRGNVVRYRYKAEDGAGVDASAANEQQRFRAGVFQTTAQRYLKRIQYGNRLPVFGDVAASDVDGDWHFEVVFDYGEHHDTAPTPRDDEDAARPRWSLRSDSFSSHRSTFEVRTMRLCRRVLMFHRFAELGAPCLVRSTDFTYDAKPAVTTLIRIEQAGYVRAGAGYHRAALPALELAYQQPVIEDTQRTVPSESLAGLDGGLESGARFVDLDGDGIPGVLIPGTGGWLYKRNEGGGVLAAPVTERGLPVPAELGSGLQQLVDVGGDGNLDLLSCDARMPGYFERTPGRLWETFRPLRTTPDIDWNDPNLRFLDVDGDGFADVVVTEDDAYFVYRSRGKVGFAAAERFAPARDEPRGPAVVFSDGTSSLHLADMTGDGLVDLVRVRHSEVCYWPGRGTSFGAKVVLGGKPRFDYSDQFDPQRVRFADVDGTGTSDLIYLGRDGARVFFNQAGNSLSEPRLLPAVPPIDALTSFDVVDLLGVGTGCAVWSSPVPARAPSPLAYVDLTGSKRPWLLTSIANNLGAETRVTYASSTKFALADRARGRPWITRLPFPVHVVERVEVLDHIAHNRFTSRYAYHHGFFDGTERELRNFGMVEQWDTEVFDEFASASYPANTDEATHMPPIVTKTWFHTGAYFGRDHVSDYFAGLLDERDTGEYWRAPGLDDAAARALLLEDTVLPEGLTLDEEREACRALRGSMLRQEVYALDNTPRADHPFTVVERNFAVKLLRPKGNNAHAIFFTHPREEIASSYERRPADPRVTQTLTLEVDDVGNVLKLLVIGHGRKTDDASLPLDEDRRRQRTPIIRCTETEVTNAVRGAGVWRAPLPWETTTYELTGYAPTGPNRRFVAADVVVADPARPDRLRVIRDRTLGPEEAPGGGRERRRVGASRSLFRADDLSTLLPGGVLEGRALPGEQLTLTFTAGLLRHYRRPSPAGFIDLLPNAAAVLSSTAADGGGYRLSQDLKAAGLFPATDDDDESWSRAGRVFFSPGSNDAAAVELAHARAHFFTPRRSRDAFDQESSVRSDGYDLLPVESRDPADNAVTATNDYRVLRPVEVSDPNGNRSAAAFDILGLLVGTALMGKVGEAVGDSLAGFVADLPAAVIAAQLAQPLADPAAILGRASTRLVYDLFAYARTKNDPSPQPSVIYTLAREVHAADVVAAPTQHSFAYCDGFGRTLQTKKRVADGVVVAGGPVVPRFVVSGATEFNNKGLPIHVYEPSFSDTHAFEADHAIGLTPTHFYDPLGRRVVTVFADSSWQKIVFDAWREEKHDANDTVLLDLYSDPDVGGIVEGWLREQGPAWENWYERRSTGARGAAEQDAAAKAAAHAGTPTTTVLDPLGRPAMTLAHNGFSAGMPVLIATRVRLDISGAQREVRDAIVEGAAGDPEGRVVRRCVFDLAGRRIRQESLDAGSRWMLADATGRPLRAWDSAGRSFRSTYDVLRRPLRTFVDDGGGEVLFERVVHGERLPNAAARNLRGRTFLQLDQSGALHAIACDFKGNRTGEGRRFARAFKVAVDWSAVDAAASAFPLDEAALEAALAPLLEGERFTRDLRFDALNRAVQLVGPYSSKAGSVFDVIQPSFDRGAQLVRVDVWHGRPAPPAALLDRVAEPPAAVGFDDVVYDAHGRRLRVAWKNGTSTTYRYDPESMRLARVYTRRPADPADPPAGAFAGLQHLRYAYDPVGNVTSVADDALQAVFFQNARVDPGADYTYDALYRLVEATGREHLGQVGAAPPPTSYNDYPRNAQPHPNDAAALGRYTESYAYDDSGNLVSLTHSGNTGTWIRTFVHGEQSLLEPGKRGDRLSRAIVGADVDVIGGYDPCGNPRGMAHLASLTWDARDQLRSSRRQVINATDVDGQAHDGETTWYVYDAGGMRVRVITETAAGQRKDERLSLGGAEVYRRAGANPLERETLHVMDGKRRIALVHRRVSGVEAGVPVTLIRHHLGNHLGSTSLEIDDGGSLVSYEEYTPWGSTSYRGVSSQIEVPNRHRFAGKERDEETGFYYYGARYYAPWLGRWISADKSGVEGGLSLYVFVKDNPLRLDDPDGQRPRLTTWLLTGGDKWEASDEEIQDVTSDMRRTDTNFNTAAGYGGLVGVVSVFENTFYLGWDFEQASEKVATQDLWDEPQDFTGNTFTGMVDTFDKDGLAAIPKGMKVQMDKAAEGDAVAFGEFAFSTYMVAEGTANTNLKLPLPRVQLEPGMAIAGGGVGGGGLSITLVPTQVGPLVGGGGPLVLMMEGNDGEGGGSSKEPLDPSRVTKGMEIDPTKVKVFRGGKSFDVRPIDVKLDKTTGLVIPTKGLSLDLLPSNVERFGGAHEITSIPKELKIIQRGERLEHFEIVPREPMTPEAFQELTKKVTTRG